jgi:3-deoxy-D-manno-octulosonic-acid transferase
MYLLYSTLLAAALLLGSGYWFYEMLRHGKYRRGLSERFGFVPPRLGRAQRSIWVHAVSVGEVLAVSELIRQLRALCPEHQIVISTTTDAGQRLAAARFGAASVFYFPFDFRFSLRRYFDALQPALIVIAETEFWPNLLRIARQRGARVAIANARISDRSFPGYRRWRRILLHVLTDVDLFLAQTPEDARRLSEIGAPPDRIFVAGNLKFDVPAPAASAVVDHLRSTLRSSGAGPVLVCGSTVEGEEGLLVEAFKAIRARYSKAVMLLAPRHPERFAGVADLLQGSGLKFHKRSEWNGEQLSGGVLLIDSIGELASLYSLADLAFVGGSLVPRGGHSIVEPAQHGVPIVVGPHTENFRDIIDLFERSRAVRVVSPTGLSAAFLELLGSEDERSALASQARHTLHAQRGATQFTLERLRRLLRQTIQEAHLA